MTNETILQIAMQQSAIDSNCCAGDFMTTENKVVISRKNKGARSYLELPFSCDLTSYGSNIVASVSEALSKPVSDFIHQYPIEHCFETPNLYVLNDLLNPYGVRVCFMAEYFLPNLNALTELDCKYETKLLTQNDFSDYYLPEWSNALCEKRKHLDQLAVGAFDQGKLVGLAGCSSDCGTMWQIGIDVLPAYRRQGVASALTGKLALEVLNRGIVPFYCCAWSNVKSARNAVKSGFLPAWVQVTAKPFAFIDDMIK